MSTGDLTPIVPIDRLRQGEQIGSGGQARLVGCVAADGRSYLFKEYNLETRTGLRTEALLGMVRWRRELPPAEQAELDRRCAWPVSAVGDDSGIAGILIRPASESMYDRRPGRGGAERRVIRHLSELCRDRPRAERVGAAYYEPPLKLAVLGRLLDTVTWLHGYGWAVGDLQPRNVVFAVEPRAEVFLLDCDSCVPAIGPSALAAVDPEQWKLPPDRREAVFDATSDFYKFAWAVIRCLQESMESWHVERDRLLTVMTSTYADALIDCSRTLPPDGTRAVLREAAAVWPRLVVGDRLYVRRDGSIRELWAPAAVPDAPVDTRTVPAAPVAARRMWLVPALMLGFLVLALVLIIVSSR